MILIRSKSLSLKNLETDIKKYNERTAQCKGQVVAQQITAGRLKIE